MHMSQWDNSLEVLILSCFGIIVLIVWNLKLEVSGGQPKTD